MLGKSIFKAFRGQRLIRAFAGGAHKSHHDQHHSEHSSHPVSGGHHDIGHSAEHHDHHDHHDHHEVAAFDQIHLDLNKAYYRPSQADLKYQTVFGLEPASGHHDAQPITKFNIEEEYWYAYKDGKWNMDYILWGDNHFTPYKYDKFANLPSGYLTLDDPLDGRNLADTKLMAILSGAILLLIITFYVGPTGLYRKSHAERVFNDFLTVSEIEDRIRKIRLENQALEEELAQLSGSESSN